MKDSNLQKNSMTTQHKLEAAIAQAQKRGWMEGWYFSRGIKYKVGNTVYEFLDQQYVGQKAGPFQSQKISLNDILFDPVIGTDFCEKFFDSHGSFVDGIECKKCFDTHQTILVTHQSVMLSMSESERIDFLYKHVEKVEIKEVSPGADLDVEGIGKLHNTSKNPLFVRIEKEQEKPQPVEEITISPEVIANLEFELKSCGACGRGFEIQQSVELKKIEELTLWFDDKVANADTVALTKSQMQRVLDKINELCDAYNTLVDYVQKLNKECRVNRN